MVVVCEKKFALIVPGEKFVPLMAGNVRGLEKFEALCGRLVQLIPPKGDYFVKTAGESFGHIAVLEEHLSSLEENILRASNAGTLAIIIIKDIMVEKKGGSNLK